MPASLNRGIRGLRLHVVRGGHLQHGHGELQPRDVPVVRAWDLQHGRRDGLPGQLHRLHAWSLQPNLRCELSYDLRQLRGGHVRDGQRVLCREQLLPLLAWLLFGRHGGDGGGDLRRLQRGDVQHGARGHDGGQLQRVSHRLVLRYRRHRARRLHGKAVWLPLTCMLGN